MLSRDHRVLAMNGLRRVQHALRTASHRAESKLGVSGAQLFVLQQLADRPNASLAELAGMTMTDPSSVSAVVRRLIDDGRVTRKVAADDARRAELRLTKKGAAIVKKAPPMPQQQLTRALACMPTRDVARLAALLSVLADALDGGQE